MTNTFIHTSIWFVRNKNCGDSGIKAKPITNKGGNAIIIIGFISYSKYDPHINPHSIPK